MRNVKLIIEYDGANYAGWQIQPNGVSIQQVVQDAIASITGEQVKLIGSGRTDAGVHASGQCANFATNSEIPAAALAHAINTKLPPDIAIVRAEDAPPDFHARYSAKSKTYRYTIFNRDMRSPLNRNRAVHVREKLDLKSMQTAAAQLIGTHDFAAFRSKPTPKSSVRTVICAAAARHGHLMEITITANGFLYNMMRAIVGTLIEIGLGKRGADSIEMLLETRDRALAGPTAPPQGLCLLGVDYDTDETRIGEIA